MTVYESKNDIHKIEWEIRSLRHAYEEKEPTRWLVDGFIAAGSMCTAYGAPGGLKSFALADLAAHVVQGSDWLPGVTGKGSEGIATMQAPVFWLDLDNGERRTDMRFGALGRALGLPEDAPLYYVSIPLNPPFVASDLEALLTLKHYIMALGCQLVIVDNLGLITGPVEENSAEMGVIMGNLRVLVEKTGCAMILIHHQRKGGSNGGRPGDALRGHSSIEAAFDLALHIMREGDAPEVTIRSTKTRGVHVPTITARFNFEHFPGTHDLKLAWFDGKPVMPSTNRVRKEILAVLEKDGQKKKTALAYEVRERLNNRHGVNHIRDQIDKMATETKELKVTVGDNNAQIISINGH